MAIFNSYVSSQRRGGHFERRAPFDDEHRCIASSRLSAWPQVANSTKGTFTKAAFYKCHGHQPSQSGAAVSPILRVALDWNGERSGSDPKAGVELWENVGPDLLVRGEVGGKVAREATYGVDIAGGRDRSRWPHDVSSRDYNYVCSNKSMWVAPGNWSRNPFFFFSFLGFGLGGRC